MPDFNSFERLGLQFGSEGQPSILPTTLQPRQVPPPQIAPPPPAPPPPVLPPPGLKDFSTLRDLLIGHRKNFGNQLLDRRLVQALRQIREFGAVNAPSISPGNEPAGAGGRFLDRFIGRQIANRGFNQAEVGNYFGEQARLGEVNPIHLMQIARLLGRANAAPELASALISSNPDFVPEFIRQPV